MPPRTGDPAVPNYEQSFAELAVAVRVLMGSQAQFMRSAASADPFIGISLSTPLLHSEELDAGARAVERAVAPMSLRRARRQERAAREAIRQRAVFLC